MCSGRESATNVCKFRTLDGGGVISMILDVYLDIRFIRGPLEYERRVKDYPGRTKSGLLNLRGTFLC